MNGRTTRWGRGTAREAGRGAGPPPLPQTLRSLRVSMTRQATTQNISESYRPLRSLLIKESTESTFSRQQVHLRVKRAATARRSRTTPPAPPRPPALPLRPAGPETPKRNQCNTLRRIPAAAVSGDSYEGQSPVIPAAGIAKLTSLAHQMDNLLEVSWREESCAQ